MTQAVSKHLVKSLARTTVEQVAPLELPKFQVISEEYFEDPAAIVEGVKQGNQQLGFGMGIVGAIFTPIVLWLANKILELAWDLVEEPIKNELTSPVNRFVKHLFKKLGFIKRVKRSSLPSLTISQRKLVRRDALAAVQDLAQAYKLSQPQIIQIVDLIVGQLPTNQSK